MSRLAPATLFQRGGICPKNNEGLCLVLSGSRAQNETEISVPYMGHIYIYVYIYNV